MMTLLGAAALLALLLAASGKGGETSDAAVMADLEKLRLANITAYNAVAPMLSGGGGDPALIIQYAAQLNTLYPSLAKKLGDIASASGDAAAAAAVASDLKKLQAANATAYAAVIPMMSGAGGNPAMMIQYAAQLNATYPALAKKLGDIAAAQVTPVQGASGTSWNLWGKESGGVSNVDVLLGAMPVLSYTQTGTDKSTRKLIGTAPGVDTAIVARARADFNV